MFLVIFIWFGRINSFAYIPLKKWDQNQVHSQKLILVSWVDFNVFENGFKKRKEASKA